MAERDDLKRANHRQKQQLKASRASVMRGASSSNLPLGRKRETAAKEEIFARFDEQDELAGGVTKRTSISYSVPSGARGGVEKVLAQAAVQGGFHHPQDVDGFDFKTLRTNLAEDQRPPPRFHNPPTSKRKRGAAGSGSGRSTAVLSVRSSVPGQQDWIAFRSFSVMPPTHGEARILGQNFQMGDVVRKIIVLLRATVAELNRLCDEAYGVLQSLFDADPTRRIQPQDQKQIVAACQYLCVLSGASESKLRHFQHTSQSNHIIQALERARIAQETQREQYMRRVGVLLFKHLDSGLAHLITTLGFQAKNAGVGTRSGKQEGDGFDIELAEAFLQCDLPFVHAGVVPPASNHFGDASVLNILHCIVAHERMMCAMKHELELEERRSIKDILEAVHAQAGRDCQNMYNMYSAPSRLSASAFAHSDVTVEKEDCFVESRLSRYTIALRSSDITVGKDADDFTFCLKDPLPGWLSSRGKPNRQQAGCVDFVCRVKLLDAEENFSGNQVVVAAGTQAMQLLLKVRSFALSPLSVYNQVTL